MFVSNPATEGNRQGEAGSQWIYWRQRCQMMWVGDGGKKTTTKKTSSFDTSRRARHSRRHTQFLKPQLSSQPGHVEGKPCSRHPESFHPHTLSKRDSRRWREFTKKGISISVPEFMRLRRSLRGNNKTWKTSQGLLAQQ